MGMDKMKWNFSSLDQLHHAVNSTLQSAMRNERCKRWHKVLENYKLLLWMIDLTNLPDDYEPPSSYPMLMYETYYHIGVGFQHLGDHKKAIVEYTNALEAVSMPKNGCLAGCVTNSCLMTPIYARRAFAYAKSGDLKNATKDAEKAVVLDSKNPGVYCVRALVKNTNDDLKGAVKDIDLALKLDAGHMCTLVLRAAFAKPMIQTPGSNNDSCMNVTSFNHPYVMEFYDKFLFTLCVPHTILIIDLTPEKPSKKQLDSNPEIYQTKSHQRPETTSNRQIEPFRCGTPISQEASTNMATKRRHDYGEAIRKFMSRPKTASAFFAQLEKERKKEAEIEEMHRRRAVTAGVRRLVTSSARSSTKTSTTDNKKWDFNRQLNINERVQTSSSKYSTTTLKIQSNQSSPTLKTNKHSVAESESLKKSDCRTKVTEKSGTSSKMSLKSQKLVIPTPVTYSIPVFQDVNIKEAPRMYYKPWKGDRLPAEDIKRHIHAPAWF